MAEIKDDFHSQWPLPAFHFSVKFDDKEITFQEVSGLDSEYNEVEYRNDNNPKFSVIKMSGLKKASDITLKKGMFKDDKVLTNYFTSIKMNVVVHKTITISLIDEANAVLFVWTLQNAFPKKVSGMNMSAKSSDVTIEEMVISHEGITMLKG